MEIKIHKNARTTLKLREEWIEEKVRFGTQVVIANPKLVQTGLDLYDFPQSIPLATLM